MPPKTGTRLWLKVWAATHSIALTSDGDHTSQFRVARAAAPDFLLSKTEADDIIDHVVTTIETCWDEVCDQARLTKDERSQLWKREFLNDYAFYDYV